MKGSLLQRLREGNPTELSVFCLNEEEGKPHASRRGRWGGEDSKKSREEREQREERSVRWKKEETREQPYVDRSGELKKSSVKR